MSIYRVCPTCGMKVDVRGIVDFFGNGCLLPGESVVYVCPGCGHDLVRR